jgi:hypothetical protein
VRLTDLNPQFLSYERTADHIVYHHKTSIAEAQGIIFLCPVCWVKNSGPVGTHSVICWSRSRGVPEDAVPGPGRWLLVGTGYDDLTLDADPPNTARSVLLTGPGCGWHGYVTNGEVTGT